MDAHRNCEKCCGKVTLWNRGDEVFRVTARKDEWGEVEDTTDGKPAWICNTCRFDKKKTSDWIIEGPRKITRHSVISANHYIGGERPQETIANVMGGRKPKLLMDIHTISEVNKPNVHLSEIEGPATGEVFNKGNAKELGN
jgi:NADH-quinone oxidoreductase subunit G